jgi:DNA-binding NarL/FixJ family response regulator
MSGDMEARYARRGHDDDKVAAQDRRLAAVIATAPLVAEHDIDRHVLTGNRLGPIRAKPTAAELAVVNCLSHGMTIGMAADSLVKAEATLKTQLRAARYRAGAKTNAHLVAICVREGWLP